MELEINAVPNICPPLSIFYGCGIGSLVVALFLLRVGCRFNGLNLTPHPDVSTVFWFKCHILRFVEKPVCPLGRSESALTH